MILQRGIWKTLSIGRNKREFHNYLQNISRIWTNPSVKPININTILEWKTHFDKIFQIFKLFSSQIENLWQKKHFKVHFGCFLYIRQIFFCERHEKISKLIVAWKNIYLMSAVTCFTVSEYMMQRKVHFSALVHDRQQSQISLKTIWLLKHTVSTALGLIL